MTDRFPGVTVRLLASDDKEAWLPLWRGYLAFYKADISSEISDLTFSRLVNPEEPMEGALATVDGAAVGMVHWIRHRSTWTSGDYGYLQDLFTDETARGRGVGRALIEYVYGRARTLGCSRVYWLTHETNSQAMALYGKVAERSGFLQYRKML